MRPFDDLAQAGQLADAIVAFVEEHPSTTFVELQRWLAGYLPVEGWRALCPPRTRTLLSGPA